MLLIVVCVCVCEEVLYVFMSGMFLGGELCCCAIVAKLNLTNNVSTSTGEEVRL